MLKITFHFPNAGTRTAEDVLSVEFDAKNTCRFTRREDRLEFTGWERVTIEAMPAASADAPAACK